MRDGGKLTGLVGDLTLGLTKPVPLELGFRGAGFFETEEAVDFVAVDAVDFVAVEVASFFAVRAVVRAVGFRAVVLVAEVGVLTAAGDFEGTVVLAADFVEMALGRPVTFFVAPKVVDLAGPADPEAPSPGLGFPLTALAVAVKGSAGRRFFAD